MYMYTWYLYMQVYIYMYTVPNVLGAVVPDPVSLCLTPTVILGEVLKQFGIHGGNSGEDRYREKRIR